MLLWDDVITLFHEFGHTLHGLFATQRYATLSGTNTPRDFVEFPSQINEHWASHPQVFARFARHVDTGEQMPQALRDKMQQASLFNKGYDMTELLSAALLDMRWHSLELSESSHPVDQFEQQALAAEMFGSQGRAAALSQQLFCPYLRWRLCRRLLCLSVDANAGR